MAWEGYTGYQTYTQQDMVKRFTNAKWKRRKLVLIEEDSYNKIRFNNAKPNERVTFISYRGPNDDLIDQVFIGTDKIKLARDRRDECDRIATDYITIEASVGNVKAYDRICRGIDEYDIMEIYTMRKKDWSYALKSSTGGDD